MKSVWRRQRQYAAVSLVAKYTTAALLSIISLPAVSQNSGQPGEKGPVILRPAIMQEDVASFNAQDSGDVVNYVDNAHAYQWLSDNIPLFSCPDTTLQKIYYFRWWSFRKHLVKTPYGFIFTEFITPVKFGGAFNSISSALGHQIYEGRWLHDPKYIQAYTSYWMFADPKQKKPGFHRFSTWIDDAVYGLFLVGQDSAFLQKMLPALSADYKKWEAEKQLPDGLFWQFDVRDAMEESISGSRTQKNRRPTINSYMYGNALALSRINQILGQPQAAAYYRKKARDLRQMVLDSLWNAKATFFEVKYPNGKFADAREEIGFIPWYFNLPTDKKQYAEAWEQLTDTTGFSAPWGITTAERRHPLFRTHGSGHGCEWDGAVWPYATTQTLKGLSNLLNNYKHHNHMTARVFYDALHKYAWAQQKDGKPFIGEYQDEKTGFWLRNNPRSRYYNHSGFADLIISDLVGIKPALGDKLAIRPLIPEGQWAWFCLDNVRYHGHAITVLWDKDGRHYGHGKGLQIFVDGKVRARSRKLAPITVSLK
ncbi:MGH1-like glycoside hydrolase domain-containing protein [Arachidicoccus terrestris]|uniref:MGH1-like glycoside hydrolase domain-containing protein n=1 Tax=Arachidicoccus terrestris TaxID=2875539 RepID=UPI001CC636AF|nr:glycosyl hydrolase family 65 protein [Arachidicoccus terrestris]UAY56204.1 glycoside hydrolase [Arachidicoccus terrestris]